MAGYHNGGILENHQSDSDGTSGRRRGLLRRLLRGARQFLLLALFLLLLFLADFCMWLLIIYRDTFDPILASAKYLTSPILIP